MGDAIISIDIELAGPEITASSSQAPSFLPTTITKDVFDLELPNLARGGTLISDYVSITMDNSCPKYVPGPQRGMEGCHDILATSGRIPCTLLASLFTLC
ncbi:hypothetical protein JHK86_025143 [Glycine max]|nr:hypothetical protein JHK86_025143 [Glycine max]